MLARQPRLHDTYRFHIDTLCLDRYYPLSGDTGSYAKPMEQYVGMQFLRPGAGSWPLTPSTYRLLWDLYEATGDVAFAQTLYHANNDTLEGLPFDLFGEAPGVFQRKLGAVIEEHGSEIALGSVHKADWHLGILRSGAGEERRALWLDYDAGGPHGHLDGMNLGLFAYGLDVLPEMGYPAVQFGGWGSPKGRWYGMTAAHNTVVVDGKNQTAGAGEATLWIGEAPFQAIRASAPELNGGNRYERTAVLLDMDDAHFIVIDVFRVAGGLNHTKFVQSHFGALSTEGLTLSTAADYGHETQTRNFHVDAGSQPGWQGRWTVEDFYGLLPSPTPLGMAYTDFTAGASAGRSEAWIAPGGYDTSNEAWIPRLHVARKTETAPLHSTFVAVYEPYRGTAPVFTSQRLPVNVSGNDTAQDAHVALRVEYPGNGYAMVLLRDPEQRETCIVRGPDGVELESDGDAAVVRVDAQGHTTFAGLARGSYLKAGAFTLTNANNEPYVSMKD